jgi:hypothetical protein
MGRETKPDQPICLYATVRAVPYLATAEDERQRGSREQAVAETHRRGSGRRGRWCVSVSDLLLGRLVPTSARGRAWSTRIRTRLRALGLGAELTRGSEHGRSQYSTWVYKCTPIIFDKSLCVSLIHIYSNIQQKN